MPKSGITIALATSIVAILASAVSAGEGNSQLELWYNSRANKWTEALPVGNGRMGAMVYGGTQKARFQFNEDTLWNGGPQSYAHAGAAEYLAQIRALLFEGKQKEAEALASEHFMSTPLRQRAYQPFGDILLEFPGHEEFTAYRRSLNLNTAKAITTYKVGDVTFRRECFASYPDRAIVIRVSCDARGQLDFDASLSSPQKNIATESLDSQTTLIKGQVQDFKRRNGELSPSPMTLAAHMHVLETDGTTENQEGVIHVSGGSFATIVVTAGTNFTSYRELSADPVTSSKRDLEQAKSLSFAELESRHLEDHQDLFNRVTLELGKVVISDKPTDQRLLAYESEADPALETLLFQYGRYLMIASSRPGSQPANLQGVWNDQLVPPWESKYTVNINAEMNYWPAEACNLAECTAPLFAALQEVAESGAETAKEHYATRGWVLHHNFDIWRGTAPINAANHGIWPTGGAWLCQHLWWHYAFSLDKQFLREIAYPLMKGAAEFFVDNLVEDPRSENGWLVSGPSNSPEHGGLVMGPTMDHQIIRELFANTIYAAEILDVDHEFRDALQELLPRIAPNQIGKHGQLQEWLEDIDNPDNRHRHVSHLWGVFPGSEIGVDTPELLEAAKQSLNMRGDGGTGWSLAWKINLWGRMRDAERSYSLLQKLLRLTDSEGTNNRGSGVYRNLFDAHPPFQIDGNFGATNGICQLLLQSYRRNEAGLPIVELLPALPKAWPKGEVTGLRARGGFELDFSWQDSELSSVSVQTTVGGTCELRCGDKQRLIRLEPGEELELRGL